MALEVRSLSEREDFGDEDAVGVSAVDEAFIVGS